MDSHGTMPRKRCFFSGFWDKLSDDLAISAEARRTLQAFDYMVYMRAFPDARPLLLEARQLGLHVGVLSNFSLASLEFSLQVIGLSDLVDAALAAPVIGYSKPSAEAYLAIAEALNVKPKQCFIFDDEIECVEGGRAVGMKSYLVDRGRDQHLFSEWTVCELPSLSYVLDSE